MFTRPRAAVERLKPPSPLGYKLVMQTVLRSWRSPRGFVVAISHDSCSSTDTDAKIKPAEAADWWMQQTRVQNKIQVKKTCTCANMQEISDFRGADVTSRRLEQLLPPRLDRRAALVVFQDRKPRNGASKLRSKHPQRNKIKANIHNHQQRRRRAFV